MEQTWQQRLEKQIAHAQSLCVPPETGEIQDLINWQSTLLKSCQEIVIARVQGEVLRAIDNRFSLANSFEEKGIAAKWANDQLKLLNVNISSDGNNRGFFSPNRSSADDPGRIYLELLGHGKRRPKCPIKSVLDLKLSQTAFTDRSPYDDRFTHCR